MTDLPRLTPERIFSDPPLFGGMPASPQFTPDGSAVAYLRAAADARERMDLWRYDISTGRTGVWIAGDRLLGQGSESQAEQAERERRRQFSHGITRFAFSADGRRLLLPVDGAAWVLDLERDELACVTPVDTRQTEIQFDPSGQRLSYVRDGDLYLLDIASRSEQRLTHDGGDPWLNGIAEFIAQEEMHRFDGHWWAACGDFIAYTRVDESPVALTQRYEIDADTIRVVDQRYPYAGASNATVELRVRALATGIDLILDWQLEPEDYLARVFWWGPRVVAAVQSRDQRRLVLRAFNRETGSDETLLTEHAGHWINLHDNYRPLDEQRLLLTSERDGHAHLYLFDAPRENALREDGLRPITAGDGRVNRILGVHGSQALILGWWHTPTEQHVYHVDLASPDARAPERVTREPGWHEASASRDGRWVIDRVSSLDVPGALRLLDTADRDAPERTIADQSVADNSPYGPFLRAHRRPRLGVLQAEDGQILHYRLTEPSAQHRPAEGAPVVVHVYGGPGVQRVRNEWQPITVQMLAQHGYGVLELDNRGTGNRTPAFEAPIHRRLGAVEVRDQVRGVEFLRSLDWVDPNRIGVMGHSYGGYMALLCLLTAPGHFRAAIATAPVTDWQLYDTHYTERYLGTPADNPAGYAESSVFVHLDREDEPSGPLLVIHGMADDNVLYTHSTRLYRALQARNRRFEMMAYPGSRHALQEPDVSIHRFSLMLDFLARAL